MELFHQFPLPFHECPQPQCVTGRERSEGRSPFLQSYCQELLQAWPYLCVQITQPCFVPHVVFLTHLRQTGFMPLTLASSTWKTHHQQCSKKPMGSNLCAQLSPPHPTHTPMLPHFAQSWFRGDINSSQGIPVWPLPPQSTSTEVSFAPWTIFKGANFLNSSAEITKKRQKTGN